MLILTTNGTVPSLPSRPSCWGAYLRTGTTLIFHLHTRHTKKKKVAILVSEHYIILSWIKSCKTSSSTAKVSNTTYVLVLL